MSQKLVVVVTGAAGRIGGGVSKRLRALGHGVVGLDIVEKEGVAVCDVAAAADSSSEAGKQLRLAMQGATSVVHCAAWPGPSQTPPAAVAKAGNTLIGLENAEPNAILRDNVAGTAAVCEAAIQAGASRFVFSSSAFAMGYGHATKGPQAVWPQYLPIDEDHPPTPYETYGLSKYLGELTLAAAARTALETSFVSLRFTNIVKRELWSTLPFVLPDDLPTMALWAYCHEDDVIEAHVRSVLRPEAAAPGTHEPYLLAAPDTRFDHPTRPLLAQLGRPAPSTEFFRGPFEGNASVFDASKATKRLGINFRSWQDKEAGSRAARAALADPDLKFFDLGGFTLESGETLPEGARLAYKVYGKGPVVLHTTSFDAVHSELEYNIGPGKTLDTDKYQVVVVNMFGNGVSFSPSLQEAGTAPLVTTIGDNVRAQRELLRVLKVEKLALVYGYSMGGLQAFEWAVAFPDFVERVAVVCGAARCSELNSVFLRSIDACLKADASWDEQAGWFAGPPTAGLKAMGAVYAGWGVGAAWYEKQSYLPDYDSAADFVEKGYAEAFTSCDANDLLAQINTWSTADVARGRSLKEALGSVRAKILLMPCDEDKYFTVAASQKEADLLPNATLATLAPIRSDAGHRAGDPHRPELANELKFIRDKVHALLLE